MIVQDIGNHLALHGFGAIGGTIFLGRSPATPDQSIAIVEYPGAGPTFTHDNTGACMHRPRFQVIVKHPNYPDGERIAEGIYLSLIEIKNTSIGDHFYLRVTALTTPAPWIRDEREAVLFTANYEAMVRGE